MKIHAYSDFRNQRRLGEVPKYDFSSVKIGDAVSFFGSPLMKKGQVITQLWFGMYSAAIFHQAMKLGEGSGPLVYVVQTNAIHYLMVFFGDKRPTDEFIGHRRFDLEPHEFEIREKSVPMRISQMITP